MLHNIFTSLFILVMHISMLRTLGSPALKEFIPQLIRYGTLTSGIVTLDSWITFSGGTFEEVYVGNSVSAYCYNINCPLFFVVNRYPE